MPNEHNIFMKKIKKWQILVFGAVIGVINGFFGGGGGMIVVPLLNKMFGLEQKKAQATALFVILPISLVSTIVYMSCKSVAFISGWPVILGIVGGGVIGAFLLNKLNNRVVKYIFIFFMLLGGVGMLIW
jgi:uncharacterized membrane protein YfcA